MPLYPTSFVLAQQQRAAARLALLDEHEYWSNQLASHPPALGIAPTPTVTAPSYIADQQLNLLLRQAQPSLTTLSSTQPPYVPPATLSSMQLQAPLPHRLPTIGGASQDTRLYFNELKAKLLGQASLQRVPDQSLPSPVLPLSATSLGEGGLPQLKRGPSEQLEEASLIPLAKRQRMMSSETEKRRPNFPQKLMEAMMLYEEGRKQAWSGSEPAFHWTQDGSSFVVIDEDAFMSQVLLQYGLCDRYAKYSSIVRKLNRWGFTRLRSKRGHGQCFQHALFRQGQFELCATMQCKPRPGDVKAEEEQEREAPTSDETQVNGDDKPEQVLPQTKQAAAADNLITSVDKEEQQEPSDGNSAPKHILLLKK